MPGNKTISWDANTRETILKARESLVKEGWTRPTIRETLYKLLNLPGWDKRHYDTLCRKLGEWRDSGMIPWGLWSDETGGSDVTPLTAKEIALRIEALKRVIPAQLAPDGWLHALFIEHEGMVNDLARMTDYRVAVVSSQGQLRREHLYSVVQDWLRVVAELNGKGVKCHAMVDYDKGGKEIFEIHRGWLGRIFNIRMDLYAVTEQQVKEAKLPTHETHQIDGWASAYGYESLRRDLRKITGLGDG